MRIGDQIGLVGFSCDPLLALLEPAISGLGKKGFGMGSMAAQLCINEIENEKKASKSRTETLSNELIIRKSGIKSEYVDWTVNSYSTYSNDKMNDETLV